MSIIYEVNIQVESEIYEDYLLWLKHHIDDMLQLDGFEKASIYASDKPNFAEIVVHYFLKSHQDLENYFKHHAEEMRIHAKELFGNQFLITRRILTMLTHKELVNE